MKGEEKKANPLQMEEKKEGEEKEETRMKD